LPTIVWSSSIGLAFVEAYEVSAMQDIWMLSEYSEWVKTLRERRDSAWILSKLTSLLAKAQSQLKHVGCGSTRAIAAHHRRLERLKWLKDAMKYQLCTPTTDGSVVLRGGITFSLGLTTFTPAQSLDC